MLKRHSFYVVVLCSVAMFMTAGCANQNVVTKDEGLVPVSAAKQAEQAQPIPRQTPPAAAIAAAPAATPSNGRAAGQQPPSDSSSAQLQSALEKIYFDFDSADLSESARSSLTKNASVMMKAPAAKIRIEGNCDERGSAEYNLALGERRAKTARQYLLTLGVASGRLDTISYGKEKPIVQGNAEAALAQNRRDEFVVISK